MSPLVEIFVNALGLAQQVRCMDFGSLDKFFQRLHGGFKFLGKLFVFLVLPGIAQGGETRHQENEPVFEVTVEALEFLGEPPHFFRVHDCLSHSRAFRRYCYMPISQTFVPWATCRFYIFFPCWFNDPSIRFGSWPWREKTGRAN